MAAISSVVLGLPKTALKTMLDESLPNKFSQKYVFDQLWTALYGTGNQDFASMQCLKKSDIEQLRAHTNLGYGSIRESLTSVDGTRKWLLRFDGKDIETVYIPQVNQFKSVGTVCVSSQIGCSLACTFCHTGTQKLQRNLTFNEIVAQIMHTKHEIGDFPIDDKSRKLTNIVYMGQGEPLLNYRNVFKAVNFINETFNYSKWRTTISTSGVAPKIESVGSELGASLAISLHAVTNDLRSELVPLNKTYPIQEVLEGCRGYIKSLKHHHKRKQRITFEYVMLNNVNDSEHEAKEMVRLLSGIDAHVNLIPFNPWPGAKYKCSSMEQIVKFQKVLLDGHLPTHIRRSRGQDIMAACGQLNTMSQLNVVDSII